MDKNLYTERANAREYKSEYSRYATRLARAGFTDEELADFFETTIETVKNWEKEHLEFAESIRTGKIAGIKDWVDIKNPLRKKPQGGATLLTQEEIRHISKALEDEC